MPRPDKTINAPESSSVRPPKEGRKDGSFLASRSREAFYPKNGRRKRPWYGRPGSERPEEPQDAPRWKAMTAFGDAVQGWLAAKGGDPRRAHLEQLWRNWEMVMGPDIAPMAHPLGHRDGLLLVGAEDHFLMQELTYAAPEILERVNAFMDEDFFHKVEFRLLFEKTPLNLTRPTQVPPPPPPPCPEHLGALDLDPESPVGRCYAAYVRLFGGKDPT